MRAIISLRLEREAGLSMITKKRSKKDVFKTIFGVFLVMISMVVGVFGTVLTSDTVYADPETSETNTGNSNDGEATNGDADANGEENGENEAKTEGEGAFATLNNMTADTCKDSLGEIGWLVCPTTGKIAEAVDWLYDKIEGILKIDPVSTEDGSPIYEIWKYCLSLTNIVFVIFLLVVIYSQITGVGISNYGIKKVLPKLIVTALLVNLSFLICSLAVDVSNIVGNGLRGVFTSVEESVIASSAAAPVAGDAAVEAKITYAKVYSSMAGGAALTVLGGAIAVETGVIWMLIPVLLGAIVAVVTGLITIALRQAVVALLIMISPLAIVAYILPNTEQWFKKWKNLLVKMLVFYPMFSLLFGASSLAGFAIVASAKDGFGVLLGTAVQIFPLFFSWKLMQMSGTFLGTINARMHALAAKPLATNRAWADSHRLNTKQKYLSSGRAVTPSLRLMQFVSNRKIARDAETDERAAEVKERGLAYKARKNYKNGDIYGGPLSRKGEEAYARQAKIMEYQQVSLRDKNNFNKGFGYMAEKGTSRRARLDRLDMANVDASDRLKAEQARGERIEYDNAVGFHQRMEAAINAHMDDIQGYEINQATGERAKKDNYKFHFTDAQANAEARARYSAVSRIMEGSVSDVQYAAATAAQGYDTQKKLMESKMQKYFELTAPTKDVEFRLDELTKMKEAASNIDLIVPGLRILNQRGDTDLLKTQLDNLLDVNIGGGINLGTHASQSLASFLMFEVKDNDPFLRRFGKYINLETARAYNSNDRKVMGVTYDEYVKGYHDGEAVTEGNPTGRMYAKKGMRQLMEGTSLDNIERTALSNLDDSLKKAYGFDKDHPEREWDVSGWLRKREEIQTAFEPAFLSASLKWLSGSEQINSGVKFWTGYELKQKKENGKMVVDENGDPEYDLVPVWDDKDNGFGEHRDEVEKYYRKKTNDYFKDQTTGQILGMRTDYRDATMEHLVNSYLEGSSADESSSERKRKYERARAEIQNRYADKTPEEAQKLRSKDLKQLKMELAGRQVRKILGETGKLRQIYRTRTSGTAINAKDWLRRWVNLDDEEALRKEMNFYDEQLKAKRATEGRGEGNSEGARPARVYDASDREDFLNKMRDLKDRIMDEEPALFFEDTREQLGKWFGEDSLIVKKYEHYYSQDDPNADNIELYKFLRDLLEDEDNYPDA